MKQILNLSLVGAVFATVFIPDARALAQQGLMKMGFFQPKIEKLHVPTESKNDITSSSSSSSEKPAFQMTMVDQQGKKVSLEDLKGKVVFINFWATWCGPCVAEMPTIQTLYSKFKDKKDVAFVILEVESNKEKATKFMTNKKLDLPVYYPASEIPSEFFRGRMPTTLILDKEGGIAHITEGMADYSGQDIVDFLNEVRAMHP